MTRDADALGKSGHGTPSPVLPTPGPWRYVEQEGDHALVIVKADDVAPEIAQVYTDDVAWGQAEADARLIAAAPDLLLAVELLMEHVETWYGGDDEPTARRPLKIARDAIAKAMGQP